MVTVRTAAPLVLELECWRCGRRITLTVNESGTELANRSAFLAAHGECLGDPPPDEPTVGDS